jgi:hypothetical protein
MKRSTNSIKNFLTYYAIILITALFIISIVSNINKKKKETIEEPEVVQEVKSIAPVVETVYDKACKYRYVEANVLNIRDNPSINANILSTVPYCTKINFLGLVSEDPSWSIVKYNGITGYASSKYLSIEKPKRQELGMYHIVAYDYTDDPMIDSERSKYGTSLVADSSEFVIGDRIYIDDMGTYTVRYTGSIGKGVLALVLYDQSKIYDFEELDKAAYLVLSEEA